MPIHYALTRAEYEKEVDATLAGSFPASDPPSSDPNPDDDTALEEKDRDQNA